MSISYKKINSMISDLAQNLDHLSNEQKLVLQELCESVYMIESGVERINAQQMIKDIKDEVIRRADKY